LERQLLADLSRSVLMTASDPEPSDELPKSGRCSKEKWTIQGLNCLRLAAQGILSRPA
jgi:hypothetical protein